MYSCQRSTDTILTYQKDHRFLVFENQTSTEPPSNPNHHPSQPKTTIQTRPTLTAAGNNIAKPHWSVKFVWMGAIQLLIHVKIHAITTRVFFFNFALASCQNLEILIPKVSRWNAHPNLGKYLFTKIYAVTRYSSLICLCHILSGWFP